MLKPYIKLIFLSVALVLGGCAGTPTDESGQPIAATPADVDDKTQAQYKQALNAMKSGQDGSAIKQFENISKQHPKLAGPFINLGILYLKKERYEDAQKALQQATTLKPNDWIAFNHLGVAYRQLGEVQKAEQAYLTSLKLNDKYANAHLNLGILYDLYLGQLPKAVQHYERYQELASSKDSNVEKWIVDLKRRSGQK